MSPTEQLRTPSYRLHKPTDQAVVRIQGRDHHLGKYGTLPSRQRYDELIAEWLAGGRTLPARAQLTVSEIVVLYWRFADAYYCKDGKRTVELQKFRANLAPLVRLYGGTPASCCCGGFPTRCMVA